MLCKAQEKTVFHTETDLKKTVFHTEKMCFTLKRRKDSAVFHTQLSSFNSADTRRAASCIALHTAHTKQGLASFQFRGQVEWSELFELSSTSLLRWSCFLCVEA
jgi:hypothetical protein